MISPAATLKLLDSDMRMKLYNERLHNRESSRTLHDEQRACWFLHSHHRPAVRVGRHQTSTIGPSMLAREVFLQKQEYCQGFVDNIMPINHKNGDHSSGVQLSRHINANECRNECCQVGTVGTTAGGLSQTCSIRGVWRTLLSNVIISLL